MSQSSETDSGGGTEPRAMIHKKILEVARSDPDASLESIADEVNGGSATFVGRVLDEYGDPAADSSKERADGKGSSKSIDESSISSDESQNGQSTDAVHQSDTDIAQSETTQAHPDRDSVPSDSSDGTGDGFETADSESANPSKSAQSEQLSDSDKRNIKTSGTSGGGPTATQSRLSDKQLETLRAVHNEPTATQEEIANKLDVTRATISKRLSDISEFNWKTRRNFVNELFDDSSQTNSNAETYRPASEPKVAELVDRIDKIEAQLNATSPSGTESPLDPELAHKVVHSCMKADYVSEEEELKLLRELL